VTGQSEVIAEALEVAGVTPREISYVEAHGTGTALGDPIEVAALSQVFGDGSGRPAKCALGSVKTNFGHLDEAAGVAGLVKTALALREKNAFTYGASSSYEWRRDAAPFLVSTAVATDVTAPAIREILAELERMQQAPPTTDELSLSTSYLDGVFPIRFETTDAIAGALAGLLTLRLPDDYYDTYRDLIRAVSAEDVLRAARDHIHLDRLQVLAVGDRAHVLPSLDGLPLGDVGIAGDDDG
jgi:hypothetical protein